MMSGYERRDTGSEPSGTAVSVAKIRVYELAKEFGMAPKNLVAKLRTLGVEVANHMSNLDGADADRVRRAIERERQESLVEERLSDTVIRRRSRSAGAARPAPAPPAPAPPPLAEIEPPAPPPEMPLVTAPASAPSEPEVAASVAEAHAPSVSEVTVEATPVAAEEPVGAAPAEVASEAETEPTLLPGEAKPVPAVPVPVKIPQPVVTGSAATGQFIQLPGLGSREAGVPKIEIKDRDEELRRMGRGGLISRGPGGRDWRAPGAPGQRPGGPPRKKVAMAGKKLKQTLITTPAEHKRVIRMGETIGVADLAQKMGVKGNEVVKKLWALGMMGVNINQNI